MIHGFIYETKTITMYRDTDTGDIVGLVAVTTNQDGTQRVFWTAGPDGQQDYADTLEQAVARVRAVAGRLRPVAHEAAQ